MSHDNDRWVLLYCIGFTSNGALADSVTGGTRGPLGPVVNAKGEGVVTLER